MCNELNIDSSRATISGSINCDGNIYLPVRNDTNLVGRIRCSTVNTNNLIIPNENNCYLANNDFSLVMNGTDGSVQTTYMSSLRGIYTSGNINTNGNEIICGKITANNFIIPTKTSFQVSQIETLLPITNLVPGLTYHDETTENLYVYNKQDSTKHIWSVFSPNATLEISIIPE